MKKCADKADVDLHVSVLDKPGVVVREIDSMVNINRLSVEEQSIVEVLNEELEKPADEDDLDNQVITIHRFKVKAKVDGKMRELAAAKRAPRVGGKQEKIK
jgi:hypothetical protein